jgi:hypothetical protein
MKTRKSNIVPLKEARIVRHSRPASPVGDEHLVMAAIERHRRAVTAFDRTGESTHEEAIAFAEEMAARRKMLRRAPSTLPGLQALLEYVLRESNRKKEPFFDNDDQTMDFLRSVYASVACISSRIGIAPRGKAVQS